MKEIAPLCNIPYKTMERWMTQNYEGFADKMRSYKIERRLMRAEENIDEFLDMDTMNTGVTKQGEVFDYDDAKLKRIKADVSLFVAETVGKKDYSKRNELAGPNGGPIQTQELSLTPEQRKRIAEYELKRLSNPSSERKPDAVLPSV